VCRKKETSSTKEPAADDHAAIDSILVSTQFGRGPGPLLATYWAFRFDHQLRDIDSCRTLQATLMAIDAQVRDFFQLIFGERLGIELAGKSQLA